MQAPCGTTGGFPGPSKVDVSTPLREAQVRAQPDERGFLRDQPDLRAEWIKLPKLVKKVIPAKEFYEEQRSET